MKFLFLAWLTALCAWGQAVTITGPLYDASGGLATCQLTIRPVSVPGFSPSIISYTIVAGDLTGSPSGGGYGTGLTNIFRHAALQLYAGTYSALVGCAGGQFTSKTYTWTIAGSSMTIQSLLGLTSSGKTWSQMTTTWSGTSGTWSAQ